MSLNQAGGGDGVLIFRGPFGRGSRIRVSLLLAVFLMMVVPLFTPVSAIMAAPDLQGQEALPTAPSTRAAEAEAWALAELELPQAWRRLASLETDAALPAVTVAVIDTGVDGSHPSLQDRMVWRGTIEESDGDDSSSGHGTHVAGIVASVSGPYPIRILPLKALGADLEGTAAEVATAVRQAVAWIGPHGERVRVINLSLGERLPEAPQALASALAQAHRRGIVVVAAAGNDGGPVSGYYPAALPDVIVVGASRQDHQRAAHSNRGAAVIAPGEGIVSTLPGGEYGIRSGTSTAASFVSGVAALLWLGLPPDAANPTFALDARRSAALVADALRNGQRFYTCDVGTCSVLSADLALQWLRPE